jgi:hypothetical protein
MTTEMRAQKSEVDGGLTMVHGRGMNSMSQVRIHVVVPFR